MWRPKGTLKPKGGANIKKKLSGKPAPTLNTKVTLEEFEVYGAQKVTITITKPKPSSNLGYFDSTPHIKGVVKDKVCVFPIINAIHLSSQSIYLTQDVQISETNYETHKKSKEKQDTIETKQSREPDSDVTQMLEL